MNPLSYEVELFGLALLLYLYDSSVLLYGNEAVLSDAGADEWSASWGWSGFLLAGRTLCVLNPFTPHRAAFRLRWDFRLHEAPTEDESWARSTANLQRLTPFVAIAAGALFLVLPLGLFSGLGVYAVGAAIVLLYGSTLLALRRLHGERALLMRAGKKYWGFAFECLACPPFAVNMIRRISLALPVAEPLPAAAARLLDAQSWERLRAECVSRVELAMQSADEGSANHLAIARHKDWLRDHGKRP